VLETREEIMGTFHDLTGQISGTLVAQKYIGNSKWLCICQTCQNEITITTDWFHKNIRLGRDGCKHSKSISIGDAFGYLSVVDTAEDYVKPKSQAHEKQWLCKCICGRYKKVLECNLKSRKTLTCGICSNRVSIPEKMVYYYLSQYFQDIQEQYRPAFLEGKEIDIFIPSLQIGIEYDGYRWHKDVDKDVFKNKICKEHGITLIRIREDKCPDIDSQFSITTPKPTTNGTHMTKPIKKLIELLNSNFGCCIMLDIDCTRDNADICKQIMSIVGFNSLAHMFPDISKEWDFQKNHPLTPDKISAHSGKKAWWICPVCRKSYSSVVASRTGTDRCGCPDCRYTKAYKSVICVELSKTFKSVKDAAKFVNRKPCTITSAIKKNSKCAGYHWEYRNN
jgi:hypothetical protein